MARVKHGSRKIESGDGQDDTDEAGDRRGLDASPRVETSHTLSAPTSWLRCVAGVDLERTDTGSCQS